MNFECYYTLLTRGTKYTQECNKYYTALIHVSVAEKQSNYGGSLGSQTAVTYRGGVVGETEADSHSNLCLGDPKVQQNISQCTVLTKSNLTLLTDNVL